MRFSVRFLMVCIAASSALLMACTPALNWRELPVPGALAQLPCKSESDSRAMDLPSDSATLTLHGCAAAGMTFVVGHIALPATTPDAQVDATLRAWQQAALLPFRASATPVQQPRTGAVNGHAFTVNTTGQDRQSQPLQVRGQWLARRSGDGVTAYQLAVIAPKLDGNAVQAFFEGLQWR